MSNLVINYEIKEISRKNSRILYDDALSGKKLKKRSNLLSQSHHLFLS